MTELWKGGKKEKIKREGMGGEERENRRGRVVAAGVGIGVEQDWDGKFWGSGMRPGVWAALRKRHPWDS